MNVARWAAPVIPIGVEEAGRMLSHNGRLWDVPCYILSEDDTERVRFGYVCIMCLEPHEQNHPAACQVCGFPIRAIQDQVFETLYQGEVTVGPSTTLAEEWERAKEAVERGGWANEA
jgi:hypothetical protein